MKKELVNQLIYGFMRVALLPFLMILCLATVIYAEPTNGQGILNRRVSLAADQREIKTILTDLSKQAEIKFVYSAQKIPARKKVSLNARDEKLGDVLHTLFAPLNIFLLCIWQPDCADAQRRCPSYWHTRKRRHDQWRLTCCR